MLFSSLVAALAFASSTAALPSSLEARQANTLDAAIKQKGRSYIGTSLTVRNDGSETNIIRSEFGSITPENGKIPRCFLSFNVFLELTVPSDEVGCYRTQPWTIHLQWC
jgi:hypothetical protein